MGRVKAHVGDCLLVVGERVHKTTTAEQIPHVDDVLPCRKKNGGINIYFEASHLTVPEESIRPPPGNKRIFSTGLPWSSDIVHCPDRASQSLTV